MRCLISAITSLFIAVLGGCRSNDAIMESWMGHHVNEVIASWGPPSQVLDDPPGKIMTWSIQRRYVIPGYSQTHITGTGYPQGNTIYVQASGGTVIMPPEEYRYTATRTFWVNGEGIIYRWAWRGY